MDTDFLLPRLLKSKSFSGEDVEQSEENPLVRVHTLENRFEADLLTQALEQENIPVLLRPFEETAYDGLFVAQMGWGALLVPADYEGEARSLIRRILQSTDSEEQATCGAGDGQER